MTRANRIRYSAIGFVALTLWAIECVPLIVAIGDGEFELTVHLDGPSSNPRTVSYAVIGRREQGERVLAAMMGRDTGILDDVIDPFYGQPFDISVPCGDRTSPLGRQIEWSQCECLIVIAVMTDGRRVGTLVEIPDGRVSRTVNVTLPPP